MTKIFSIILSLGLGVWLLSAVGCSKAGNPGGKPAEKSIAYYIDPMNPANISDHPGKAPCGMDMVPVYVGDKNAKGIRIDPEVVQNIGVTIEAAQKRVMQREIRASGTVALNESKVYTISTKITGWANKLYVNYTGEKVVQGQPLLDIFSPELVSTQEEYLQALRYAESLPADASEESHRGAKELAVSARTRLLNWDIPDSEVQSLTARGLANKTMTLRALDNGVVLEKMVEQGQKLEPGMLLYRIADLSQVWIQTDIYQQDLSLVAIGDQARVTLSSWPGKTFTGTVAFISPIVNPNAKTAQARIVVHNTPDFQLKPGMFANVQIIAANTQEAVAVPEQAIIHSGERTIAVVELGQGYFDPREVRVGITAQGYIQILDGITAGEKVVTSAQFLIDSESNLKSAIQMMSAGHAHAAGSSGDHEDPKPSTAAGSGAHPGMTMPGMDSSATGNQ